MKTLLRAFVIVLAVGLGVSFVVTAMAPSAVAGKQENQ